MIKSDAFWHDGLRLSVFFAILFTVCFIWFYIRGGGNELTQLHNNLLALAFFGWSGMNAISFILGIIQSFIWGYIATGLWYLANSR